MQGKPQKDCESGPFVFCAASRSHALACAVACSGVTSRRHLRGAGFCGAVPVRGFVGFCAVAVLSCVSSTSLFVVPPSSKTGAQITKAHSKTDGGARSSVLGGPPSEVLARSRPAARTLCNARTRTICPGGSLLARARFGASTRATPRLAVRGLRDASGGVISQRFT